jgi:predicted outer membrane repeat protein
MLRHLSAVLILALAPTASAGDVLAVNSTLDLPDADLLDGVCDADLLAEGLQITLRAAVQHANVTVGADTITLPAGQYKLKLKGADEDAAATGDLDLLEDVTITGEDATTTVVIAKKVKDRVFEVPAGVTATISGLTLRGGFTNEPDLGGAAIRVDGTLLLSQCIVAKNRSLDDAGGVEFSNLHVGPSTVTDVSFEKNKAADDGAGVDVDGGGVDFVRCTFVKNKAGDEGGGFESSGATATFLNCTFSGNSAKKDGGALNVEEGGDLTLTHCTLAKNKAPKGAGLSIQDAALEGTDAVVRNCLFSNTKKLNFSGTPVSGGGNLETGTTGSLAAALDQSGVVPKLLLLPLAANGGFTRTHLLKPGSPALDAADDTIGGLVGEDQRGLPRPVDIAGTGATATDVGAVEMQADEVAP